MVRPLRQAAGADHFPHLDLSGSGVDPLFCHRLRWVGAPFLEVVGANSESGLLHLLKSNMIHIPELSNA